MSISDLSHLGALAESSAREGAQKRRYHSSLPQTSVQCNTDIGPSLDNLPEDTIKQIAHQISSPGDRATFRQIAKKYHNAMQEAIDTTEKISTIRSRDQLQKALAKFPYLEFLNLSSCLDIADLDFKNLPKNITGIDIFNPYRDETITKEGIKFLKDLPHLTFLSLGKKTTDTEIAELHDIPQLKTLLLESTKVTNVGIKSLEGMPIECLNLRDTLFNSDGMVYLKGLPSLKKLILDETFITNESMKNLQPMQKLKSLSLWGIKPSDIDRNKGLEYIKDLQLEQLIIADTETTSLEFLTGMSSLEKLHIGGTAIDNNDLKLIRGMKKLRKLNLSGNEAIHNEGIKFIQDLQLTTLNLTSTSIDDDGLSYLQPMQQLKELDLTDTNITDKGLQRLNGMSQLKKVILAGTKTTDAGKKNLQSQQQDIEIID